MIRIIITSLFISVTICSFGQGKLGVKIYQNTDIFEVQYVDGRTNDVEKVNQVNFNRVSLALTIDTKKRYTHEIEFLIPEVAKSFDHMQYPMNYEFQKKADDFVGQASSYSLRYELNKTLTNKNKKLDFNFGVGINPYYVQIENIPTVETRFYSTTKLYGFALNIVPRIKYKLSQRFSVDLNVPLKVYDLRAEKYVVKNPSIPRPQQTTITYNNIFFETAYTFRIGLMYRLGK